ncbi:MAG: aminoglycoside phosphotransferase family protein [Kibdelosporangium sp.]
MSLHRHRRQLTRDDLAGILDLAGVGTLAHYAELTQASYNTAYRIRLADDTGLVLKVAPDPAAPGLTHEHGLMRTEALFYQAAQGKIPVPRPVHAGRAGDHEFLLMTELPGENWVTSPPADRDRLRHELGTHVAALHEITGDCFGYPQNEPAPTWRAAFTGMLADILGDARHYQVQLPEIRDLMAANEHLLDTVETPVLVHFDLWDGNILRHEGRISGIVDGERAFWGDPIAELASLSIFGDIRRDQAFLDGYGGVDFDDGTRRRLAMYRGYLFMIMITETAPRGYEGAEHEKIMALARRLLLEQLEILRAPAG